MLALTMVNIIIIIIIIEHDSGDNAYSLIHTGVGIFSG